MSGGPADSASPVRDGGWTPWRDHDGTGCPLPAGTVVEVKAEAPDTGWSGAGSSATGWRRPDALERLRQIAAAPPVLRTEEKAAPFLPVEEMVE